MLTNKAFIPLLPLLILLTCSQTAICRKGGPAELIIKKMAAQYANSLSYQDTGVVVEMKGEGASQGETVVEFKTYFARPHFFRFEWADSEIGNLAERLGIIWNNGKQTYSYYGWDDRAVEKQEDISSGIAGATGVSSGSAHTVLVLLMGGIDGFRLTEMTNLSLLGEGKFDGVDCYIVRGYHPFKFPIDIWIGKQDYLLRKVKEPKDDGSYKVEVRRNVRLNGKISPELFDYTLPRTEAWKMMKW